MMEAKRLDTSELERWERIDDVIYDMTPPPSSTHQKIVGRLLGEFHAYLKGKQCTVFPAPFGVWLNGEDGDYVEPDITIVCDPSKIHPKGCIGTPDLIIEVLSPSTALKDRTKKLNAYCLSGVREYWIVDPFYQTVEAFTLAENVFGESTGYGKAQTIQVAIFENMSIDLNEIFD